MDLFEAAIEGRFDFIDEYFLVGSVLDSMKDGLLQLLRGLCDNPEKEPMEFLEKEYVYYALNQYGLKVRLRTRSELNYRHGPEWIHLRYLGDVDPRENINTLTMVRTYIDCLTSVNLYDCLQAIGFNKETEFVFKGYLFHKGRLNITVSKCFIVDALGQLQPISTSYFVEITCIAATGFLNWGIIILKEFMMNEIRRFADLLKPCVQMRKLAEILVEMQAEELSQR